MGLLGKVVKSTAAEQVMASATASQTFSVIGTAEAFAAQGTARFAALSANALMADGSSGQGGYTRSRIALASAKVSVEPVGLCGC